MPVVFQHRDYGALPVANMIDVDNEMTDDIELAMRVVCPLPNGEWLAAWASTGKLVETGGSTAQCVKSPKRCNAHSRSG